MAGKIVIALYRPHEGKENELETLVERHVPVLRAEQLVTERPATVMRAKDGTMVEVFEWNSEEAAQRAHSVASVAEIWGQMAEVSDFVSLGSLQEADGSFPHFDPVDRT
jgi:hypothetical protein